MHAGIRHEHTHAHTHNYTHIITPLGVVPYAAFFSECKRLGQTHTCFHNLTNSHIRKAYLQLFCLFPPFSSVSYGIYGDLDTAGSPLSSPLFSVPLLPHLMLSFHSALCPDSDIARPLPPMSLSEICRSKNIHPLIQTTAKKNAVLGPGVAGFFPWAISPVPENRESLRLMFNLARTGNACNLSCQNVSHALQFRSKHLSVARCVYKQTYQSGFTDRPISCPFLNLFSDSISTGI